MNKLLKGIVRLSLILCFVSQISQAKQVVTEQLPILKQDEVHQIVARRVKNFFSQSHYRNFALNRW